MNSQLQQKCELFVQNKEVISKAFAWNMGLMSLTAALVLTEKGIEAKKDKLKECEAILKNHASVFSEFRGNIKVPFICKMAASDNPERYFTQVETVYKMLNAKKLLGNEYKILAAMTICDYVSENEYSTYVAKTNAIYEQMKEKHRWLTSDEDMPFAAILAVSDIEISKLIDEMESCYTILKGSFSDSNAVQSLSHVLALGDMPSETKCARVEQIFDALKKQNHKFGSGHELSSLGALALGDLSVDEIAAMISEVDDFLKVQRGFGALSLGSRERRIYAAQLCLNHVAPGNIRMDSAVLGNMLAVTIAAEVCMLICISSCAVAANN